MKALYAVSWQRAATPFATHMRHGFVLPVSATWGNWLALLAIGEAGIRAGNRIRNDPTKLGFLVYGPFKYLEEGRYLLSIEIKILTDVPDRPRHEASLYVEVIAGPELLGVHFLRRSELNTRKHKFTFVVPHEIAEGGAGIETRICILVR